MADAIYVDVKPHLGLAFARQFHAEAQARFDRLRGDIDVGPLGDLQRDMMMVLELLLQLTEGDDA